MANRCRPLFVRTGTPPGPMCIPTTAQLPEGAGLDFGLRSDAPFTLDDTKDLVELGAAANDVLAGSRAVVVPEAFDGPLHHLELARLLPRQTVAPAGDRGPKDRVLVKRAYGIRGPVGPNTRRPPDRSREPERLHVPRVDPQPLGKARCGRSVADAVPSVAHERVHRHGVARAIRGPDAGKVLHRRHGVTSRPRRADGTARSSRAADRTCPPRRFGRRPPR